MCILFQKTYKAKNRNEEVRFLVIEDNPRDLRLMREYFSDINDMNIDVFTSSTLDEGIRIHRK
jgi:hypothetical protein